MKGIRMNKVWILARCAALLLLSWSLTAASEQQLPSAGTEENEKKPAVVSEGPEISLRVPFMSPRFADVPIASVNEETITVGELTSSLESAHEGKKEHGQKQAASIDVSEILNRLITVKLIVREAREMGMDELPEVKKDISATSKVTAREVLIDDITKDVKADEAEVEKLRRQMVREWKIKSVLFEKEDDAKKMEAEIKAGKSFEELAAKAVEDKTAKSQGEGGYVKSRELLPDVAAVVSKMEPGTVSPVIKVASGKETGFTILKLEEIRYPEDPESLERARGAVLSVASIEAVKNFKREAYKKNVKTDTRLLEKLNFEAKNPGFAAMLKDKRSVATVKGEKPVTVADLAKGLDGKFFHGIDRAIEEKKVNNKKLEVLDELLEKRLFDKEIAKRGIEKTESFRKKMKAYEDSVLFGMFVRKVLLPDVKATEEELKAYYDEHKGDYTNPEMMRISALIFGTQEQAESAIERLKKGADFNWMKSNAEGQVDSSTEGLLSFKGGLLITKTLDQELQNSLRGAKPEEYRLFKSKEGHFYVLYIQGVAPSSLQPYEEAREDIGKKVFDMKVKALVDDWVGKLRETADVKVYLASSPSSGEMTGKH
ncbi:MAG: peptidyl-prolyl cis-trans isomerase [Nitrospiraceae bacterium]|nr:MAG: peptidyl-prolyl cis-trans isomerase [Nitrospiraceae bacterium]